MRSEVDEGLANGGAVDFDSAMRDALYHESAEVLRHQIECERASSAKLRRPEVFVAFLLMGLGIGVGVGSMAGEKKRRRRARG